MLHRRSLLATAALAPLAARAQAGPITLATLVPLTGAGAAYGRFMRDAAAAVIRQVNGAGGVLGRQIQLLSSDSGTSPDKALTNAQVLIEAEHVSAILGTWASAVTQEVAPLCWGSQTFLATVSGDEAITQLPHQGYLVRTQPNTAMQSAAFVGLAQMIGAKQPYFLGPQTPFAERMVLEMNHLLAEDGVSMGAAIYQQTQTSYADEIGKALQTNPDTIFAGGYAPDTAVLLGNLSQAGYKGNIMAFGYAVAGQPNALIEGVYTASPSPAVNSPAYKAATALLGRADIDTYTAQVYDQTGLVLLAMQLAGGFTGTDIKDFIRKVSQGAGPTVSTAIEGVNALKAGAKALDYDGASGPCTFDGNGGITQSQFRFDRAQNGQPVLQGTY